MPAIEQQYFEVPEQEKFKLLCRLLDIHNPELAMIFGRTKRRVDELTEALQKLGYQAEGLHGDLTQRHRDMVMNKFRNGQIHILVATDVAARGLDITGVTHVFNFDLPQEIDSYVHRIGRTGRAGKEGLALTFVEPREFAHLKTIEKTIQRKLVKTKLPSAQDSRQRKQDILYGKIVAAIKEGHVLNYQELANDLIQEYGSVDVLAAVLELMAGDNGHEAEVAEVHLTAERPIHVKYPNDRKSGRSRSAANGGNRRGDSRGGRHNGGKDKRYQKDLMMKKDYVNKAGKNKTYSRDGKKGYKNTKKAAE